MSTTITPYLISREFFYALTMALVAFISLELIRPRLVTGYVNVNAVLILWLIAGMVTVRLYAKTSDKKSS